MGVGGQRKEAERSWPDLEREREKGRERERERGNKSRMRRYGERETER